MNTVKGLLVRNLAYFGFTYYPNMQRSMFKSNKEGQEFVSIVDLSENGKCQVIIDCDNFQVNKTFDINNTSDIEAIINCATSASKVNDTAKFAA
ncbi:MAG: hypothetical protein ACRCXN_12655 [Bacteroidales bacterium]